MPTYIALNQLDRPGRPQRQAVAAAARRRAGAGPEIRRRDQGVLHDHGAYDLVVVLEAPDDRAAAQHVLALAAGGNLRTTTLKAFPEGEYREIMQTLP